MTILTNENFKTEVEDYKGLVVIDLFATWCGPCRMIAPIVEELAGEMPDVKFCKIDVDQSPDLARLFRVESIPTIVIVKDNTMLDLSVGYTTKEKLSAFISQYKD